MAVILIIFMLVIKKMKHIVKIQAEIIRKSALIAFLLIFSLPVSSQHQPDFSKKGEIHDRVIHLWNTRYRDHFASEIERRLFRDGDVYVLYDVQIGGLQSFVEMTRRCRDTPQIAELADLLTPVFSVLKPVSDADSSTGWICTGGNICTAYGFIGKEVPLCSVQFLGLLGALATSISENIPPHQQTAVQKAFVSGAFNTMSVQLNRWLTAGYFASVDRRLHTVPADIKDGSSRNFFSDRDLWYLTVLSDMSELHRFGIQPSGEDGKKAFEDLQQKKEGIRKTFDLFLARTVLSPSANGVRADLDKGFWKYYFDNRYAGYSGSLSPVGWENGSGGKPEMKVQVKWDSAYIAQDAGWDISHSRRLVPALETFVRNRDNIKAIWGYDNPAFDPAALRKAFANQVVEKIWNGDMKYPLFSNFWSGDNGWYRVAYANQTGRQFAGYPPYGLTISMADGGYPVWSAFNPTLNQIFRNIFQLSQTEDDTAGSFALKHYRGLFGSGPDRASIRNFSFLSDLVELPFAD
ncbi:MAG: hypothetical protein ABS46_21035 [Cytophagaceae bacterium SCN 52-12]|nr:MAG: hypothetical protein ABS46_21035 [Cytophagaceae bacterium SCN 52-12]